ncbi:HAD-IC family P-type ATPase [Candidatus Uhrbacteria bacterium]|nr:HAD-IC family P-type ATPase [Candidatus Uhrbacteria bacterium]
MKKIPAFDSEKQRPFWSVTPDQTLQTLNTTVGGLSEEEAAARRATYGENAIKSKARLARTAIILNQFKSPLLLILLAAGVVTVALNEFVDAAVIFLALFVNTGLGYWQENKAESVLEELRTYIRTQARIRRDGQEREVDASFLVPGDIIHVAQGNRVPADARILSSNRLVVDESILTGESLPVEKTERPVAKSAGLGDRACMLWSGTLVAEGYANAVVTATGAATEFGRLAALTERRERVPTPLQRAVSRFAMWTGIAISAATAVLFVSGIFGGVAIKDMFVLAVAVAVSSVPEGLPIALTIILAVGVERLVKKRGVVRKLLAAETLGSTSVILTDKTGTLTEARMTLAAVLPVTGSADDELALLKAALLNTDVAVENPSDPVEQWRLFGKPLEMAIVRAAGVRGIRAALDGKHEEILDRIPFNSTQKFSQTTVRARGVERTVLLGAPEILLGSCATDVALKRKLLRDIDRRASNGERLLGVAMRTGSHEGTGACSFLGLLAFRDPIRPTVKDAIARMRTSGVATVIVTGDHRGTAEYVARELGVLDKDGISVTGEELAALRPAELKKRLKRIALFARVTPEQKVQILRCYKDAGEIVAVTGDGVNDGPALKAADIGVAVGSGTEVAKGAADLVLLDDNFETLVAAIEEGRRILANIRKVIVYLLSDAMDELFLIGGAIIAGLALPLNALQILFVNFFSDSFPAIAFAFETHGRDAERRSRRLSSTVIDKEMTALIVVVGLLGSALQFGLYVALLNAGFPSELVRTFVYATFATYSLIVAFSLRSLTQPIGTYPIFSNTILTLGVGFGLVLTIASIYLPFLQTILGTTALPLPWLAGVFALALVNIGLVEIVKWKFRSRRA